LHQTEDMSALPQPEPTAFRYAPYIEELHVFFADHHLYYGSPKDLISLVERLEAPGFFHDEFRSVIRAIINTEGGTISRASLLEIVSVAIGGPLVYQSARELQQPLTQLFDALTAVIRRMPNMPHSEATLERGQLVTFPSAASIPPPDSEFSPYPRPSRRTISLFSSSLQIPVPPTPIARSARNLLVACAAAVLVAILLSLALRQLPSVQTPSRPSAAPAASGAVHPAKPSPYGEAFAPTQPPARRHHAKPPVVADAATPATH
jgi:hypothetical protein